MNEQEFLARISSRLGRRSPADVKPQWQPSLPLPNIGPSEPEALAERFTAELTRLGGVVHRATSEAQVGMMAAGILLELGLSGPVVRWEDPTLEGLAIDDGLESAGFPVILFAPGLLDDAEKAVAGVTGVDWAIAETGSLVLSSHRLDRADTPGRGRVVSLLPPVHIAVVRKEQLIYSTVAVFRGLAAGQMPPQVVFASGPSRSADIENDLTIGVHGPGQVHVIIV